MKFSQKLLIALLNVVCRDENGEIPWDGMVELRLFVLTHPRISALSVAVGVPLVILAFPALMLVADVMAIKEAAEIINNELKDERA